MSTGGPLRQAIPVARSILWGSASEGAKRPGNIAFPVFFAQAALNAVHEHVATPTRPGQGVLGFLIGDLCECPETNVSYLVIDAALRLNQAIYGDRTRDVITRLWDRIEQQLEQQKAHLIGWYHTHPPMPLSLSPHDTETHEQYFGEPWQVALLLGTDPAEPTGAFFRAGSDEEWMAKPLPFYELLEAESIRPDGKKRSFVTWRNYRAFGAAAPARAPAAKPPSEPKFTPAAEKPKAPPPPPPPSRPSPQKPDDTHELKFLTAAEDMGHHARASGPHAPPTPPKPEDRSELKFLTAAEDAPPPAPPRRPTPPPRPRVGPPPRPAPPPPPTPPPPPPPPERPPEHDSAGPATGPLWPEEFDDRETGEAEQPAEEPEPRRPARRRRRRVPRKVWLTLFVLLVGAGAGGAYWWFQPELPLPEWSTVKSKWSEVTSKVSATAGKVWALRNKLHRSSPAPGSAKPGAKPATRQPVPRVSPPAAVEPGPAQSTPAPPPPPPPPSSVTRLDLIGDSLTGLVRNFGERAALYGRGQLPCAGLARGLTDVENRWIAYNAARRSAGVLDAAHSARDQTLYAGVDSVERRFEQSGCPRP
jgi:hypothetical protein